jgi:hypothetical protein
MLTGTAALAVARKLRRVCLFVMASPAMGDGFDVSYEAETFHKAASDFQGPAAAVT